MFEISHLVIRPDTFGLAVVQERRDRIGRMTAAGWVWKTELKTSVEDSAIGLNDFLAVTSEEVSSGFSTSRADRLVSSQPIPPSPWGVIEAPEGAPGGLALIPSGETLSGCPGT